MVAQERNVQFQVKVAEPNCEQLNEIGLKLHGMFADQITKRQHGAHNGAVGA
jgi:hypothetical protein